MSLLAKGELQIARLGPGSSMDFGATATHSSTAMTSNYVVINTSAAVCFLFGAIDESAATSNFRISADQTLYLRCSTHEYLHAKAADSAAEGVVGTLRWADLVG